MKITLTYFVKEMASSEKLILFQYVFWWNLSCKYKFFKLSYILTVPLAFHPNLNHLLFDNEYPASDNLRLIHSKSLRLNKEIDNKILRIIKQIDDKVQWDTEIFWVLVTCKTDVAVPRDGKATTELNEWINENKY